MASLITWFFNINPVLLKILGAILVFLMIFIPYRKSLSSYFRLLLRFESLDIDIFEYRLAEDHFLGSDEKGKHFFLKSEQPDYVINGGKITLSWSVRGAWRTDIKPIGKNLSNTSSVDLIVRKNQRSFVLTAYGLFKRITIIKEIPEDKIVHLRNQSINIEKERNISGLSDNFISERILMKKGGRSYLPKTNFVLAENMKNGELKHIKYRLRHSENKQIGKNLKGIYSKTRIICQNTENPMKKYAYSLKKYNKIIENK